MNRLLILIANACFLLNGSAYAGGRVQTTTTIPFVQPFLFYSYGQAVQPYQQEAHATAAQLDSLENRIADKVAERLAGRFPAAFQARAVTPLQQHCVKCHGSDDPKAGLSLAGELSADLRLKAIGRITHPDESLRMPPTPLPPERIGELIQSLAK